MLIDAILRDLGTPEQLLAILDEWRATGATAPSLMDITSKLPSHGIRTRRQVGAAVVTGYAARQLALDYLDAVKTEFSRRVIDLTYGLTADGRNAEYILAELEQAQAQAQANAKSERVAGYFEPAGKTADDGYRLARETFAQRQQSIDCLKVGLLVNINRPEVALPAVQGDLHFGGIGVRQNLVNRIYAAASDVSRVVRGIANGEPQRLLAGLYGAERAATYCAALNNELLRLNNAHDAVFYPMPIGRTLKRDRTCQAIVKLAISPLDVEWLKDPAWMKLPPWPAAVAAVDAIGKRLSSLVSHRETKGR